MTDHPIDNPGGDVDGDSPMIPRHLSPSRPPNPPPESALDVGGGADEIDRPAFADHVFRHLDPAYRTTESIGWWIFIGILFVPSFIAIVVYAVLNGDINPFIPIGWFLAFVFFVILAIWTPGLVYRHSWYAVSEVGIEIKRGWLWRRHISIPRSRIQHTDVSQGPLMRRYKIAKLVVHTAGTHNASVELPGLSEGVAKSVRDYLVQLSSVRRGSDGV